MDYLVMVPLPQRLEQLDQGPHTEYRHSASGATVPPPASLSSGSFAGEQGFTPGRKLYRIYRIK